MIGYDWSPERNKWVVDLGDNPCEFDDEESAAEHARYKIEGILAERLESYGDFRVMAVRLARGWSAILGVEVEPHEVMLCMANLKLARLEVTPDHGDSKLDRAAYLTMATQLLRENEQKV